MGVLAFEDTRIHHHRNCCHRAFILFGPGHPGRHSRLQGTKERRKSHFNTTLFILTAMVVESRTSSASETGRPPPKTTAQQQQKSRAKVDLHRAQSPGAHIFWSVFRKPRKPPDPRRAAHHLAVGHTRRGPPQRWCRCGAGSVPSRRNSCSGPP